MENVNDYKNSFQKLLNAADMVITKPSTTVNAAINGVGLVGVVMASIICSPPIAGQPILNLWKKIFRNKETEKEKMLKEIIRKQQTIIKELERRNVHNEQEIRNLKDMLKILKDLENAVQNNSAA